MRRHEHEQARARTRAGAREGGAALLLVHGTPSLLPGLLSAGAPSAAASALRPRLAPAQRQLSSRPTAALGGPRRASPQPRGAWRSPPQVQPQTPLARYLAAGGGGGVQRQRRQAADDAPSTPTYARVRAELARARESRMRWAELSERAVPRERPSRREERAAAHESPRAPLARGELSERAALHSLLRQLRAAQRVSLSQLNALRSEQSALRRRQLAALHVLLVAERGALLRRSGTGDGSAAQLALVSSVLSLLQDAVAQLSQGSNASMDRTANEVAGLARSLLATLQNPATSGTKAPPEGLTPADIARLPVQEVQPGDGRAPDACAICLSNMTAGERLRVLPGCKHACHVGCMDEWLRLKAQCPICRDPVCC